MYTYETSVRLHDTDAAGVLFFGNYFRLAHMAYESFMESIGYSFRTIIHEADYLILIVHAEADFRRPLYVGDRLTIDVRTGKLGRSSFSLEYDLKNEAGETVATANSVHVNTDKTTGNAVPLPEGLKAKLEEIRQD